MKRREYVKQGLTYQAFSICIQIINIFLIPIYTKNLSIEDFGQYNIITSVLSLLSMIVNLGIFSGLTRFYNEYEDKNSLKNTALTFSTMWGITCCTIGILLSDKLSHFIFRNNINFSIYLKFIFINSFMMCLITIYSSYFSMQFKALKVSLINLGQMLLTFIFGIFFVVIIKKGVLGTLYAQTISSIIIIIILISLDFRNINLSINNNQLSKMLRFGVGLLPGNASAWILTLIDRYFLQYISGLSAVAIYSMGYKIGMLIQPLLLNSFSNIFNVYRLKVYKDEDAVYKLLKPYRYYNFISWLFILGISLFADTAIHILSTDSYSEGYKIVPAIAISYYLYGLGDCFYGMGLFISNKTIVFSIILFIAACINIIFNFLLIPRWSMMGASIATIISYIFINLTYYFSGKKYYNISFSFVEPLKYFFVFLISYAPYIYLKGVIYSKLIEVCLWLFGLVIFISFAIIFKLIALDEFKYLISIGVDKIKNSHKYEGNRK
ncbi:oligosaccharide flippase family protein [Clostridium sp. CX1]|uniref:oligosaccharide flippase family protein n=1 Tax=Clostridium sp. CX1 TaxID=2978346 RepID=UPI0021C20C13|nr:oligosaccharide flippase family protein [Clostridium sp. CX1]MCT8975975.1 oligosaccharide flippase family protein [Clostridium sp. CX1]